MRRLIIVTLLFTLAGLSASYARGGMHGHSAGGLTAPAYTVTGMRLDWNNVFQKPVDLSFYVKNLFNKAFINGPAFTGPTTPLETVQFGDPRTFAVQLRYRFGG